MDDDAPLDHPGVDTSALRAWLGLQHVPPAAARFVAMLDTALDEIDYLNEQLALMEPGALLELRASSGPLGDDFRDYLDGKPIHNGDQLMLWYHTTWIWARYEVVEHQQRAVDLYSVDGTRRLDRATMRFRWPTKED